MRMVLSFIIACYILLVWSLPYTYADSINEIQADQPSRWAKDTINSAIELHLVPPFLQNNFQQLITRAEFASFAVTFLETKTNITIDAFVEKNSIRNNEEVFLDTNNPQVLAVYCLGIVDGTGDCRFEPDSGITREQMAAMLTRTMKILDVDISNPTTATYTDSSQFSPWAIPYINFVTAHNIMEGVEENCFDALAYCSREQAIVTFYRMYINSKLHSNQGTHQEPPKISITADDVTINYVIGHSTWNGAGINREVIMAGYTEKYKAADAPYVPLGSQVKFEFDQKAPSDAILYDYILGKDGFFKYTETVTITETIKFDEKKAVFKLPGNPHAYLSSETSDYEPGATIRGFILYCRWEDNTAYEYFFVLRSDYK